MKRRCTAPKPGTDGLAPCGKEFETSNPFCFVCDDCAKRFNITDKRLDEVINDITDQVMRIVSYALADAYKKLETTIDVLQEQRRNLECERQELNDKIDLLTQQQRVLQNKLDKVGADMTEDIFCDGCYSYNCENCIQCREYPDSPCAECYHDECRGQLI